MATVGRLAVLALLALAATAGCETECEEECEQWAESCGFEHGAGCTGLCEDDQHGKSAQCYACMKHYPQFCTEGMWYDPSDESGCAEKCG